MIEAIIMPLAFLASLAVVTAAILAGAALIRASNTAEKEEGFIICGGAASEMAKGIRAKQEEERRRHGICGRNRKGR